MGSGTPVRPNEALAYRSSFFSGVSFASLAPSAAAQQSSAPQCQDDAAFDGQPDTPASRATHVSAFTYNYALHGPAGPQEGSEAGTKLEDAESSRAEAAAELADASCCP